MDQKLEDKTLRAAVQGDQQAWWQLVQAYSGRVYGLIYRQCGDPELAEEITQITFVKMVGKLADYQERGKFESWVFRIALNRLRDEIRRRKRQAIPVDFVETPPEAIGQASDEAVPEAKLMEQEQATALHRHVKDLPEADQEILYLRYTSELSFAQIAEVLDQPLGTVLARGHRALKKLRAKLEGSE